MAFRMIQERSEELYAIGENYYNKNNYEMAIEHFKLAAEQGHAEAQFMLGACYVNGLGIPKDINKALEYYQLAASQDHVTAQYHLGILYEDGQSILKDLKKAVEYYQLAASQGLPEAQYCLGIMLQKGEGVAKDLKKAVEYHQLAANQGIPEAQRVLGDLYANGQGVPENIKEALRYYQLAAKQGDQRAQYKLGTMYMGGRGVSQNLKKAAKCYQLAADQNYAAAQYDLGIMYQNGCGVLRDDKQALHYIKLAAKQGSIIALHNLSIRNRIGRGVEKNAEKAAYCYQLATTVKEEDKFRQFIANKKLESNRMTAPSLLLRICEETSDGKGLYEYVFSPDIDLSQSYIPWYPPFMEKQRGPTCGLDALRAALKMGYPDRDIPPVRKNPIKPTPAEKEENKAVNSLRQEAKRNGSAIGEENNVYNLEKVARAFKFNECKVIEMEKEKKEHYIKHLLNAIRQGHTVVLPVDDDGGFPGNKQGQKTHYALAWGYIFNKKENKHYFLVSHYGRHCLWDADALQKSHEQLPDINPHFGEYYKDSGCDSYFPKQKDPSRIEENQPTKKETSLLEDDKSVQKKYIIPPSNLSDGFKFAALIVPRSERNPNLLELKVGETKEGGFFSAVKNSDAMTLRLLAEASANSDKFPSSEDKEALHKTAKRNGDFYSSAVLESLFISEKKPVEELKKEQDPKAPIPEESVSPVVGFQKASV